MQKAIRCILLTIFVLGSGFVWSGIPHRNQSVLSSGMWYKVAVNRDGIHKITYDDFVAMGFNLQSLSASMIRVYGNGGGMLPELNSQSRIDDLREVPVQVVDDGNDRLDPGEYLLFYGESPDEWILNTGSKTFAHTKNLYSDSSYYYVNADLGPGKRIVEKASLDTIPNFISLTFGDYAVHEFDSVNVAATGRRWFGERFDVVQNQYLFGFNFPNLVTNFPVRILTTVAAKAPVTSTFILKERSGTPIDSIKVDFTDPQSINVYGKEKFKYSTHLFSDPGIYLDLSYRLYNSNCFGWLNYVELNAKRRLIWDGPQMQFCDPESIARDRITEFHLKYPEQGVRIWNISRFDSITEILPDVYDTALIFRERTDTVTKFIAFDGSLFYPVRLIGPVTNQNLHALGPVSMVIVSHPLFMDQAERLAGFHRNNSGMSVAVVSTEQVYNEFSSGRKELTAIRDFMKMLYDRAAANDLPKYLLLFGDGSYDPKNRIPNNNNLIPTFQSEESLKTVSSYVSDDYFGLLDDGEGEDANGNLDLGIGRFPVSTVNDATIMVDKIIRYAAASDTILGDWRNTMTFIADDENKNLHLNQAEELTRIVADQYPVYNVRKIYLDAYKMVQTPSGMRLPDVNTAINEAVANGTLILNYTGHGGEDGWAAEKVLTIPDIQSWTNRDRMPVFITATCEFSRFDNPERYTAGEMVLVHENGGAIALYSTTRLALATSNFKLDTSFFHNLLPVNGGPIPKMGDLIRISKNNNSNNLYIRNFVLLGDPAQAIAFPANTVVTSDINEQPLESPENDTLLGLSTVTVKGRIADAAGNTLTDHNGTLYPKVFDKPVTYTTIGNTDDSYPQNFELQNRLLFSGKSEIHNGGFEFSFVVPKNIGLQFGKGKISYYARTGETDANGYCDQVTIGGQDPAVNPVNPGPQISLYLDDPSFVSGGRTGTSPELHMTLTDPDGINAIGLGIGHEILAVLDNDGTHPVMLNDVFMPEINSFRAGTVYHKFENLSAGIHTLTVRAWDMFDNSSEATVSFHASTDGAPLVMQNVLTYPNPLETNTEFRFDLPELTGDLHIRILIYAHNGTLVKTIEQDYPSYMKSGGGIAWDGTSDQRQALANGFYVYRFIATNDQGSVFQTSQKLLINK